jgi:hypothetical protein
MVSWLSGKIVAREGIGVKSAVVLFLNCLVL